MQANIKGKTVWINLHHLYYFYVVVNEGNLARASKMLSIGQPTLSSQIRRLEQNIEVNLFDRTSHKLELTEAGKIAHRYASDIFRIGSEMMQDLRQEPSLLSTTVRVGILVDVPKAQGLAIFKKVIMDHTQKLQIIDGRSNDLLKELMEHKLDVLITNYPPSKEEIDHITTRRISSSPVVICGHKKFKSLALNFPKSLENAPFMLPLESCHLRTSFDSYMRKNRIKINIVAETNDIHIQKIIAEEGLALIVTSQLSVKELLKHEDLIEIGHVDELVEEIFILSHDSKILMIS